MRRERKKQLSAAELRAAGVSRERPYFPSPGQEEPPPAGGEGGGGHTY
jgi:hypothetical protein